MPHPGKPTDDDLTMVERKNDKLLGLLQRKYGYAKDKAEQEYKDFASRFKGIYQEVLRNALNNKGGSPSYP